MRDKELVQLIKELINTTEEMTIEELRNKVEDDTIQDKLKEKRDKEIESIRQLNKKANEDEDNKAAEDVMDIINIIEDRIIMRRYRKKMKYISESLDLYKSTKNVIQVYEFFIKKYTKEYKIDRNKYNSKKYKPMINKCVLNKDKQEELHYNVMHEVVLLHDEVDKIKKMKNRSLYQVKHKKNINNTYYEYNVEWTQKLRMW